MATAHRGSDLHNNDRPSGIPRFTRPDVPDLAVLAASPLSICRASRCAAGSSGLAPWRLLADPARPSAPCAPCWARLWPWRGAGDRAEILRLLQRAGAGRRPGPMLLADCTDAGALRGYARVMPRRNPRGRHGPAAARRRLSRLHRRPGHEREPQQGIVALEGDTLAEMAEYYFATSDNCPARSISPPRKPLPAGAPPPW